MRAVRAHHPPHHGRGAAAAARFPAMSRARMSKSTVTLEIEPLPQSFLALTCAFLPRA